MGMATTRIPELEGLERFDPETAERGMAYKVAYQIFHGYYSEWKFDPLRFVAMYKDDPIFEYWDKGTQKFSIFDTDRVYRDPENDIPEDEL